MIEGKELTMLTPLARGIDRREIKATVASLVDHDLEIKSAIDMLLSGF